MAVLRRLFDVLNSIDLDEVLAYRTPKVVIIKDRLLGSIRLAGFIAIACYFVLVRIVADQGYYEFENVVAITETSLEAPANGSTSAALLPYCLGSQTSGGRHSPPLPCVTGSAAWVMLPSTGNREIFVATRLKEQNGVSNSSDSYFQEPEAYTVGVTFVISAPNSFDESGDPKFARSIERVKTRLLDQSNVEMTGALTRVSRFDVMTLGSLLHAAGISDLDAMSGDATFRHNGAVLVANIHCQTDRNGGISECDYKVKKMPHAEAKVSVPNGAKDVVQRRRGIKIFFQVTGRMGVFKWSALVIAWVSAFAMLSFVSVVVDTLLRYVMPLRDVYSILKWEESVDFSDFRQGCPRAVHAVENLRKEARTRAAKHPFDEELGPGEGQGAVIGHSSLAACAHSQAPVRQGVSLSEPGPSVHLTTARAND
mmetsp:Transcript_138179/g.441538  ORF Transcript_138179/g.441538 Transcript_138179/m.441538 type:complete len:425 (-) Transcript_138179:122-1396(-)